MARPKGDGKGRLGGRAKGTPNKITVDGRKAIAEVVNGNAHKVQENLDRIIDPEKWIHYYCKLCEFVIPKQAAVALSAENKLSDLKSELEKLAETEI